MMVEGGAVSVTSATAMRSMAVVKTMCFDENWQQYRLQVVVMVWEKIWRCGGGHFLYRVGSLEHGGYYTTRSGFDGYCRPFLEKKL